MIFLGTKDRCRVRPSSPARALLNLFHELSVATAIFDGSLQGSSRAHCERGSRAASRHSVCVATRACREGIQRTAAEKTWRLNAWPLLFRNHRYMRITTEPTNTADNDHVCTLSYVTIQNCKCSSSSTVEDHPTRNRCVLNASHRYTM